MDFRDSAEEAAYRAQAREWIGRHAIDRPRARGRRPASLQALKLAKEWQALKADAGYACIDWPVEDGGGGGTPMQWIIFDQEEARAGMASPFFGITHGICLPTVLRFGSEAARRRFGPPAVRGEQLWCQLWSEPNAGSDLAAVSTRAEREGEGWRVNGQKVWTSYAQFSDFGLLIARTDPTVPKHQGLSVFWVDMKAPGVDVRPIHQMSGGADFNEVHLTDVRLEDAQRLGPVDGGWKVILFALMNERLSISFGGSVDHGDIIALAAELGLAVDPALQAKIAEGYVRTHGVVLTRYRTLTAISRGETPGPENAIGKLVSASQLLDTSREGLLMQGEFGYLDDPGLAAADGRFQAMLLWSPGFRLGGGADEIMRTIIGEKVLGLPSEPKADAGVAFNARPA